MRMVLQYSLFLVIALYFVCLAESANILLISTLCSPSHSLWFNKLAELLLSHGHKITLLDNIDRKEEVRNLTRVYLEGAFAVEELESIRDLERVSQEISPFFGLRLVYSVATTSCRNQLNSPGARRFMDSVERGEQHFQLVIHDGVNCESFLGWVWRLPGRPALVQATAYGRPHGMLAVAGEPMEPAYVVTEMTPFTAPMDFLQRVANTLYHAYLRYLYAGYMAEQNAMARAYFGEGLLPLETIARNACVFLVNNHFLLDGVRPHVPAVIPIAGFHIAEGTNQMSPVNGQQNEVENFIRDAEYGVIYFSLGTNILSANMDATKQDVFLEVFRALPQRVIWKWESDSIHNKPPNVMVSNWFPQNEILAHPKVKLFISHGGLLGTQEAIYHGVPMVVIPFVIDQHSTAEKLKTMGVAVALEYSSITKTTFKNAVRTVLTQKSFAENMRTASKRFVDMPDTPQERAVFWIEYALRHPDCAHIRSPAADMPPYQRMLLDVYLLFAVITLVAVIILASCIKLMYQKMARLTNLCKHKRG